MVADKQIVNINTIAYTNKLFKQIKGDGSIHLLGGSGLTTKIMEFYDWYYKQDNMISKEAINNFHYVLREKEDIINVLAVIKHKDKITLQLYNNSPYPTVIENEYFAIGTGSEFALGALYCNKNAIEALTVAANFDPYTNGVFNIITFDDVIKSIG